MASNQFPVISRLRQKIPGSVKKIPGSDSRELRYKRLIVNDIFEPLCRKILISRYFSRLTGIRAGWPANLYPDQ
jgi:hypothetical protein